MYVKPLLRSQQETANKVRMNYDMLDRLDEYVSSRCKHYVLPALCNYAFPPCDLSHSEPIPRKFCRADCLMLKNDICKREFEQARQVKMVSQLLPNCSSMPTIRHQGDKGCIQIVNEGEFQPCCQHYSSRHSDAAFVSGRFDRRNHLFVVYHVNTNRTL